MRTTETDNPTGSAPAEMLDLDRGPAIKGTRITVYTILEYLIGAWSKERIAELLKLRLEEVQAAIDYINDNDLEVLRTYVKILERIQRGNSPEVQAKFDASRGRARALMERIREAKAQGASDEAIRRMIHEYRKAGAGREGDGRHHGGQ